MRKLILTLALSLGFTAIAAKTPFWGDTEPLPPNTPAEQIGDGQFTWIPDLAPHGPIAVVVSLDEQRVYAYRNGVEIGVSSASTGKHGHETPTGVFQTLQKDKDHHSSTYNNAPMPYTQRLTWDGISLHAGGLPGYPSSHGCVHLPSEFARLLFEASPMGMTVVIANEHSAPQSVAHPGMLMPVDTLSGESRENTALSDMEIEHWSPEKSPEGPINIVVSGTNQRVVVLRNGVEIGRARIEVVNPTLALGTHVYVAGHHNPGDTVPWHAVGLIGHETDEDHQLDVSSIERLRLPERFTARLLPLIESGTTLLITDGAISTDTHAVEIQVVNSDPPHEDISS
ncbi:L,D-transpeptidase [Marinobacterium nitratireducens]|uniref:L,D-transpeptidase n=1 Tax=Marinobacterium nitratireducens TaxID=518897 RepID=A0A917ZNF7_9GAMM|nr:L,D-transpeptidase [Marinobacterium nitratireducens]GGO87022.1 L,D-transpeptidase [Marinobacterium nitratireducens]